jgi:hypothetical protein
MNRGSVTRKNKNVVSYYGIVRKPPSLEKAFETEAREVKRMPV